MFAQHVVVLRNILVVKVGDAKIEKDIEQEWKIKKGVVITIHFRTDSNLHAPVDSENPERLYKQVQGKDQEEVGNEFSLHFLIKGVQT